MHPFNLDPPAINKHARVWIGFMILAWFAMTVHADGDDGDDGGDESSADSSKVAHAAVGSTAWVFVFPVGALAMRLAKGSKAWLIHASIQTLGLALITAGAGAGIYVALVTDQLDAYHAIIGLLVFALGFIQATGGILAHVLYAKHQKRNMVGRAHAWLGRAIVTLGMINGGLGLLLAEDGTAGDYIAYGVVAGVIWIVVVANAIVYELKGSKKDQKDPAERRTVQNKEEVELLDR